MSDVIFFRNVRMQISRQPVMEVYTETREKIYGLFVWVCFGFFFLSSL